MKIQKDLSETLQTDVQIEFLDNSSKRIEIFQKFQNIMTFVEEVKIEIDKFKETPELIKTEDTQIEKEYFLTFDSLRSNCRVTHQPDFGDAFIYYKSQMHFEESSLVKYLSSFRSEYHFHEECCEMIYTRLREKLNPEDKLFVCALYTRRGGIDICPARWSFNCNSEDINALLDLKIFARNGIKQ